MQVDIKTYDPDELVGDDRLRMEGFDAATRSVDGIICNLDMTTGIKSLDMVLRDVCGIIRDEVADQLASERVDLTCSLMEANPDTYIKGEGND